MQRFCLALDLVDDAELIKEYEKYHAKGNAWPAVTQHDIDAGILNIEIFRTGNRMFMILETVDEFTFEKKAAFDATNPTALQNDVNVGSYSITGATYDNLVIGSQMRTALGQSKLKTLTTVSITDTAQRDTIRSLLNQIGSPTDKAKLKLTA
jgi:L-rhamnose mutarotase